MGETEREHVPCLSMDAYILVALSLFRKAFLTLQLRKLSLTLQHVLMKEFTLSMNKIAEHCQNIQTLTVRIGARFPMDHMEQTKMDCFPKVSQLTVDAYLGRPHYPQKNEPSRFMADFFASCPNARRV